MNPSQTCEYMDFGQADQVRFPIAMAYVRWQGYHKTYPVEKAFRAGTIFPELDKQFCGKRGIC